MATNVQVLVLLFFFFFIDLIKHKAEVRESHWTHLNSCLILLSTLMRFCFYEFSESPWLRTEKQAERYSRLFNIISVACLYDL